MRYRLLSLLLAAAVAVLVTTLPATIATSGPAVKSPVTIALTHDAITLEPARLTSTNERIITYFLFDYLLSRSPEGKYGPWLAESWRRLGDTRWEFKLRKGVKFHNGEDFTAEAVQFTFHRVLDPANRIAGRGQIATFKEFKIVDDYTIQLVTHKPDPLVFHRLLRQPILPPKYFKERGEQHFSRNPVGTGPYVFKEWVKDSHLSLEANPRYWAGDVPVKRVIFKPTPEYATRVALLRTGEVDLITNVVPDQAEALGRERGIKVVSSPTLRGFFLILRPDTAPLNKREVRQALNYAIDKEAIVRTILKGYGVVATGQVIPKAYIGYNSDLKAYPFDQARARQLLAEAGYPNGFDIELSSPIGQFTLGQEISDAIAAQLGRVGVRVKHVPTEYGVWARAQIEGKLPAMSFFGFGATFDGGNNYDSLFTTGQPWGTGVYWTHPEIDKLNESARSLMSPKIREAAIRRVGEIVREEAPVVFLYNSVEIYAVRDGVPFKPRPDEQIHIWPWVR
jgi:peptide/nickel transport system substrate-binding protein